MKRITYKLTCSLLMGIIVEMSYLLANAIHTYPTWIDMNALLKGHGAEISVSAILLSFVFFKCQELQPTRNFTNPKKIVLGILSIVFGFLNVAGSNMAYLDSIMILHGRVWNLVFWLCIFGYAFVFYIFAALILYFLGVKQTEMKNTEISSEPVRHRWSDRKVFFLSFCTIFAFWSIWVIAYYPAGIDYDSLWQISSYYGWRVRSDHHPWISNCLLGIFHTLGLRLKSENLGMFLYIFVRDIVLICIYSRCVLLLKQVGFCREIYTGVLGFYAITPIWGAYAKQCMKDVFAAGLFCWFIIRTIVLVRSLSYERNFSMSDSLLYALSGLCMSLFRHNYLYVMVATSIILCVAAFVKKEKGKIQSIVLVFGILIYTILHFLIINVGGIVPVDRTEACSIPFQQTARTFKYHGDTISTEERENVNQLINAEVIADIYDPVISDVIKEAKWPEAGDKEYAAYFKTWWKQFLKYPITYLEATVAGSYGYYAFVREGYPSGGRGNCGMNVVNFINRAEFAHFDEWFHFSFINSLENLRKLLAVWQVLWHRIPLLGLTDSMPFYTWSIMILFIDLVFRKRKVMIIPVIACLVAVLTVIASPVNGAFRYFSAVAVSFPALLACLPDRIQVQSF